jgi:hypothetical protein
MKNLTKLFLGLLLGGIIFTGCKEASELVDVKFSADYETELNVTVVPSTGARAVNGVFSVTETIDPSSDSDFAKYFDRIKGVDIEEVSGLILSVEPNITLSSTFISIYNDADTATWEYDSLPIIVGTVLTLDNDNGQLDAIELILLEKKPFTVAINGQADEDNAEFDVKLTINSTVLANPLD